MACGWLGWTPDTALDTPLGQIRLALAGKVDFLRKTNPWRSKEDIDRERAEERGADPAGVAQTLLGIAATGRRLPVTRKTETPDG